MFTTLRELYWQWKLVCARETVHVETARRAHEAMTEAATVIRDLLREKGEERDIELVDRLRHCAQALFAHYGPTRSGSRLFVLAKRRARLHSICDAGRNIALATSDVLDDDRELE